MKNLIIDERIRKTEYEYLSKYFNIIKLPLSDDVYEEISGHTDIFYTRIKDVIYASPNCTFKHPSFKIGNEKVKNKYPDDVKYNVCEIGEKIIGSKYTDKCINPDVVVKQGYVKCSIAVTSNKSCITTDYGIAKKLQENGIDVLLIEESNIKLLKKDKSVSNMKGFIGGATLMFDNKFVLFGDANNLANKNEIIKHLNKYNLKLIDFKGFDIYDYGGGLIY